MPATSSTPIVNPVALRRVEHLFFRNERAVIPLRAAEFGQAIILVPVAAVLAASIHFYFLDVLLNLTYQGPNHIAFNASSFRKGQEMGYFHHGSTILFFTTDQQSSVSISSQETLFVWGNRCCEQCSTEKILLI